MASPLAVTFNFTNGNAAEAEEVDQNFTDIVSYVNTNMVTKDGAVAFTAHANGPASDPTTDNQYARKKYVNDQDALKLALGGGTMTGALVLSGAPTIGLHPATKTYADAIDTKATNAQTDATTSITYNGKWAFGRSSGTTSAFGLFVIPHGLGTTPVWAIAQHEIGATDSGSYSVASSVYNFDGTNITLALYTPSTGVYRAGVAISVNWIARKS